MQVYNRGASILYEFDRIESFISEQGSALTHISACTAEMLHVKYGKTCIEHVQNNSQ